MEQHSRPVHRPGKVGHRRIREIEAVQHVKASPPDGTQRDEGKRLILQHSKTRHGGRPKPTIVLRSHSVAFHHFDRSRLGANDRHVVATAGQVLRTLVHEALGAATDVGPIRRME